MNIASKNQDPQFYSRDYYLSNCAGSASFKLGGDLTHELYVYIFNKMKIDVRQKKVLDLGCGRGELCIASMRRGASKVVGIDFSADAIELAKENLRECSDLISKELIFKQANALELSLDEKFDVIFLTDIVEHLYDDQIEILFKKVEEHLSVDGRVIIHTMPTKEFILVGQFFKFFMYLIKGRRHTFLTFKSQASITHVNLHHKEQLKRSLKGFKFKIWYDFADQSFIKAIISKTPLVRLLSGNLWAVASRSAFVNEK
jgi:2-polyprenyl-3-methyl-5-hydroxy-6-metoxy-1,4-benzoquinol methylase